MLWLVLLGCHGSMTDSSVMDTGDERLRMGRISGTISIDPELAETIKDDLDKYASFFAMLGINANAEEVIPIRIHVTTHFEGELEELAVPYVLGNLFPQEEPYLVIGMLDTDSSVRETGQFVPTSGDVMSVPSLLEQHEVVIESNANIELDLVLKYQVE